MRSAGLRYEKYGSASHDHWVGAKLRDPFAPISLRVNSDVVYGEGEG